MRRELGTSGRLLLRDSDTGPLARVMIEAADGAQVEAPARRLADVIRREIGEPGEPAATA